MSIEANGSAASAIFLTELFFADIARRPRIATAGRLRLFGCPSFLAKQRNESHIGEVLAPIFVLRNPCHPHKFLGALIRTYGDHQPAADFELVL